MNDFSSIRVECYPGKIVLAIINPLSYVEMIVGTVRDCLPVLDGPRCFHVMESASVPQVVVESYYLAWTLILVVGAVVSVSVFPGLAVYIVAALFLACILHLEVYLRFELKRALASLSPDTSGDMIVGDCLNVNGNDGWCVRLAKIGMDTQVLSLGRVGSVDGLLFYCLCEMPDPRVMVVSESLLVELGACRVATETCGSSLLVVGRDGCLVNNYMIRASSGRCIAIECVGRVGELPSRGTS